MLRVVCGALILTGLMVQSAEACRHRRCGGCGAPASCCQSAPSCESAPASTPAPPPAPQARSQGQRQFSYEAAQAVEYVPRTSGAPYAIRNDRKIIGSYGLRPASDKAIGNY